MRDEKQQDFRLENKQRTDTGDFFTRKTAKINEYVHTPGHENDEKRWKTNPDILLVYFEHDEQKHRYVPLFLILWTKFENIEDNRSQVRDKDAWILSGK